MSDTNATLPEVTVTAQRDPSTAVPRQPPRLSRKRIDVTFTKAQGTFAESGTDTVKLSGLRIAAQVTKAGANSMGEAQFRIWGMTLSKMNDLSTLGQTQSVNWELFNNKVIVEAGDDDTGMAVIFHGTIYAAWADFNGMPDCPFYMSGRAGLWEATKPVPPTSYRGLVDVSTLMSGLASIAGWNFENNGVTTKLENVYQPDTVWNQVQAIKHDANINAELLPTVPQTLAIWPVGQAREGQVPLINRDTGMIGYPAYTNNGIVVTTVFNPSIGFGQDVKVETDLKSRNPSGIWNVLTLTHTLEAEVPHGVWQTRFEGIPDTLRTTPQRRS